jgi:hypothetical protein
MNDNSDNKEENRCPKDAQGDKEDKREHENTTVTVAQKARIERNRQAALLLKQARLIPHPYAKM